MLIWHMTGTRSGRPPDMAAAMRALGVMGDLTSGRIAPSPAPVKAAIYICRTRGYHTREDERTGMTKLHLKRASLALILAGLLGSPAAAADETAAGRDPYKPKISGLPFAYYSPETKLAFGLGGVFNFRTGQHKEKARTSSVWVFATYSLAKQYSILLKPEIYLKNNSLAFFGSLRYERSPQNFYGIGDDTEDAAGESYTPRSLSLQVGVKRRVAGALFGGLSFEFEDVTIEKVTPGGLLASGAYTGSHGGMLAGFGVGLDWDTRDAVLFPRRGTFIQLLGNSFGALAGSDYSFTRVKLDARQYLPAGRAKVLVLQTFLLQTFGDVPFYKLALLGGDSLLRGYYKGRFRDKGLVLVQAEYRVLVSERIGIVGFAGLANVFAKLKDFEPRLIKYSLGTGLRYVINKRDGATLRLDLAWGRASFGLYATAQEAF
jgi:Omp85 superfamily domain